MEKSTANTTIQQSIEAALRLRNDLGLGSFPVDRETKRPRIKSWQTGGLQAPESILKVFERMPDGTGVGVPTGFPLASGGFLYVLDVDRRHGGLEALEGLPELPETPIVETGDGWHYWLKTVAPVPGYTRDDGLELKGAGQQVLMPLEPPAPRRRWLRSCWEYPIADCPDWLLPAPETLRPAERKALPIVVDVVTGEVSIDLGNPLAQLRKAKPGNRRVTLRDVSLRVKYRADKGLIAQDRARASLFEAALEIGIEPKETNRILDWVFSLPSLNPQGSQGFKALGGEAGAPLTLCTCNTVTPRHIEVLRFVCEAFTQAGKPFEAQPARPFSTRWVCEHTTLIYPMQAARCLNELCAAQLLWKSPSKRRYKPGQRPCHKYRPTYAGLALIGAEGLNGLERVA